MSGYMYICGFGPGAFGNTKQKINSNGFNKKKRKKGGGGGVGRRGKQSCILDPEKNMFLEFALLLSISQLDFSLFVDDRFSS